VERFANNATGLAESWQSVAAKSIAGRIRL